jgi:hypothetical protein
MAIKPTKLGQFVRQNWDDDDSLLRRLREAGLLRRGANDTKISEVIGQARDEHRAIRDAERMFNSPYERVRVMLRPFLNARGRAWAVPWNTPERPWWKFWV